MNRWQDWGNMVLGAWMFVSPWVLGFAPFGEVPALSAWMLGSAIALLAVMAIQVPQAWEEGINSLLGISVLASPWVLDFERHSIARSNAVIVGTLVTALAVWAMLSDVRLRERIRLRLHLRHH
jgi:hypothetical protein